MSLSFCIVINFGDSPGHISVTAAITAEDGVVNIHMLSAISEGILMLLVFLICSEHLAEMLCALLVHKAVMQDCRFTSS